MNMGRTVPEDDGRDERDASQRTPKIASKQSEVRKEAWYGFLLRTLRKNQLC